MNCFPMQQIRILELHKAYGEPHDYVRMLEKGKHSLRALRFNQCDVLLDSCWSTILRWLQGNLKQKELWLENMIHPNLGLYICGEATKANADEYHRLIGAAKVRDGLRKLLERPNYADPPRPE